MSQLMKGVVDSQWAVSRLQYDDITKRGGCLCCQVSVCVVVDGEDGCGKM